MTDGTTQTVAKKPSWWQDRTPMERRLLLVAVGTLLAAGAFIISLGVLWGRWQRQQGGARVPEARTSNHTEEDVCLTPGCIRAASLVLSKLDTSAEPCDDFYQYACGSYVRNINIPDDKSSVHAISALVDQLLEKLRNAVEEQEDEAPVARSLRLARDLYRACMDKGLIETRGLAPIRGVLRDQLGGWPVLEGDSWDEAGFDWLQSVYRFQRAGYSEDYFFKLSVETDHRNSSRRAIYLDLTSLGLGREQLVKGHSDKAVAAYLRYQVDVAVLLGADRARAKRDLKKSLTFEIGLAKIAVSEPWQLFTLEQLQKGHPLVPWLQYLRTMLPPHVTVSSDDVVVLRAPTYLKMLEFQLQRTSKRVLANYVMWRAVETSVKYMTEELRERQLIYTYLQTGRKEWQPRSRECVQIVAAGLPLSAGAIYVRRYFDEKSKKAALEMVADIRREFLHTLQEVDWMDDDTKKKAVEKAQSMVAHIAYPEELLDDNKLDQFYEKLEVNRTMYLESVLNVTKFLTYNSFSQLQQPVNKTDWVTHGEPTTVDAYYDQNENSILFPAGILQGAFFSADRPKYMNYGGIGSTIGHEITHGFDDQGHKYDKHGNLAEWWEPATLAEFLSKARCVVWQYGNFTDKQTGMSLNGANTQGENIADNGGIKQAYRAYLALESRISRAEPRLPALAHHSPRQMFWLSVAQTWCSKYRKEQMVHDIQKDVHAPSRFRILGSLSNRPEFARDFGCPLGSRMNPEHKCQVW